MARHQHDRVLLRVADDLLEALLLDRREHPLEDAGHDEVQDREERRVHVRGDLAEDLLGVGPRGLRRRALLLRALRDDGGHRRMREHDLLHAVARQEERPFDDALLAVEEEEDRAPHLAREGLRVLAAALGDERGEVDLLAEVDRELAVRDQEARDLREVGRPGRRAVGEVQHAPRRARPLAPEERDRDEEDGLPGGRDVDDLGEQIALPPHLLDRGLAAAHDLAEPLGAEEEEERAPGLDERARRAALADVRVLGDRGGVGLAPAPPDAEPVDDRPVVPEADAVREAREPEPLAREQRVHEEVVEAARVPHHVHDGAARLEPAQVRLVLGIQRQVAEVAPREPAEEEVEARRHRRAQIRRRRA